MGLNKILKIYLSIKEYEKKNEFLVIFMIFQFLEINEKKNSFIMENENFFLSIKILMGYCPFCIVREEC